MRLCVCVCVRVRVRVHVRVRACCGEVFTLLAAAAGVFLGGPEDLAGASLGGGALAAGFLSPPLAPRFAPGSSTLSAHSFICNHGNTGRISAVRQKVV